MTKQEKIQMQIEIFDRAYPESKKKPTVNQDLAAKLLGCSPGTLRGWTDEGIGPFFSRPKKKGSRILFTKLSLAEWLIDTQIQTA